ncbi:MAG: hypothetical protein WKF85_00175 [Chitinophagaceae bacterium]
MPLALENWNALINTTLHPANENLLSLPDESLLIIIQHSKDEEDRVRTLFLEGILERPKVKDKQQYVKLTQAMLIRMLDKLYFYSQKRDINNSVLQLYDTVSHNLENMLDFIEDFFGNYFDHNEKVPTIYFLVSIKELCGQLELFKKAVQQSTASVHDIGNILINNFNSFSSENKTCATYNELIYQRELLNQLLTDDILASENSIKEVLFYFNYNDDDYIAYLFKKLNALTQSLQNKKEKIAALRFEQKNFNQLPTRLNCLLSSGMQTLKEQINHWIEEEIKFLELDQPYLSESNPVVSHEKGDIYVHVPFKGSEIYLLHKSFLDSGGAAGETYKSLFEKTGSHLTNKNQKGFSTESLQKCSDKVDYEAMENVKRFLQKMIRNIDSY